MGNTSVEFQKNVLRVLEYQDFERIGGHPTITVDVRVVAATTADLGREIETGKFRPDLECIQEQIDTRERFHYMALVIIAGLVALYIYEVRSL